MIRKEQNDRLTQIGPGTPCGNLMRSYWHPVAPAVFLDENPVRSVRLLGEDLTLYRDREGKLGLVGQRCPHRLVDLKHGIPEANGLRCPYHGWMFDGTGACVDMPLEPPELNFKDKIKIAGYPVEELGGLIWAYLGPLPAPLLPKDDLFVREDGFRQIVAHTLPCNWLQVMENRADLGHAYYTHGRMGQYIAERMGLGGTEHTVRSNAILAPIEAMRARSAYPKNRFVRNEFGFAKAMLPSDRDEAEGGQFWEEGMNPVLFPYQLVLMNLSGEGLPVIKRVYQIGVPIDDVTTWHIYYLCYTFPKEVGAPKQSVIPYAEVPLKDETGAEIVDYTTGQDMVVWTGQGSITDRTQEHLGTSDTVILAYRQMLDEQITIVENGGEPMNVFRDEASAFKRDQRLSCVRSLDKNTEMLEALQTGGRPGAWIDLKVDGDIGRYCPDLDVVEDLYKKTVALWDQQAAQAERGRITEQWVREPVLEKT